MKAIQESFDIIKRSGILLIVAPKKESNFDHNREVTSFEHLLKDFTSNTNEEDLTHLNEILELHDLSMDTPAGTPEQFRERSLKNYSNRALHQHVFDMKLLYKIYTTFGLEVVFMGRTVHDYIIVGRKI